VKWRDLTNELDAERVKRTHAGGSLSSCHDASDPSILKYHRHTNRIQPHAYIRIYIYLYISTSPK